MSKSYCIVDIEATGGNHKNGRIIEVGMVKVVNGKKVAQWECLFNPHRPIDKYVSRLTGIVDKDLRHAPNFEAKAQEMVDFAEGCVFVGHNVDFDYTYLRTELHRAGIEYEANRLCTLDLSRKVFVDEASYSLGKLCRSLGLETENRHRALGDAESTTALLLHLQSMKSYEDFESACLRKTIQKTKKSKGKIRFNQVDFKTLPDEPGVFTLKNAEQKELFIGRAESIKIEVTKLFSKSKKYQRFEDFQHQIASFDYKLTGNELLSELLYYDLVQSKRPVLNIHLRQLEFRYCLGLHWIQHKLKLAVTRMKDTGGLPIVYFRDFKTAEKELIFLVKKHQLRSEEYKTRIYKPLAKTEVKSKAAIRKKANEGNFKKIIAEIKKYQPNGWFYGEGRTVQESCYFLLDKGKFVGYAIADSSTKINKAELIKELIPIQYPEAEKICWHFFIKTNQYRRVR